MGRSKAVERAYTMLYLVKSTFLLGMMVLISPMMMAAMVPVFGSRGTERAPEHYFVFDIGLWYAIIVGATVLLFGAAWRAERARGESSRAKVVVYEEVVYNIMALHGGLWYGLLCGSLAWDCWRDPAKAKDFNMMAGITAVFVVVFITAVAKFAKKLRAARALAENYTPAAMRSSGNPRAQ